MGVTSRAWLTHTLDWILTSDLQVLLMRWCYDLRVNWQLGHRPPRSLGTVKHNEWIERWIENVDSLTKSFSCTLEMSGQTFQTLQITPSTVSVSIVETLLTLANFSDMLMLLKWNKILSNEVKEPNSHHLLSVLTPNPPGMWLCS